MDTLTAYHEAGHSALSPLMGELLDRATIRADGDSGGHTALLGVEAHAIFMAALRGRTEADRDRVMSYLVGLAAGAAAQSLRMNRGVRRDFIDETSWETFGGSKDYKQLQYFVAGKARGLEDVTADDIVSEAFDLLEQPTVWGSVERVAKDLLRCREVGEVIRTMGDSKDSKNAPGHKSAPGGGTVNCRRSRCAGPASCGVRLPAST